MEAQWILDYGTRLVIWVQCDFWIQWVIIYAGQAKNMCELCICGLQGKKITTGWGHWVTEELMCFCWRFLSLARPVMRTYTKRSFHFLSMLLLLLFSLQVPFSCNIFILEFSILLILFFDSSLTVDSWIKTLRSKCADRACRNQTW